MKQEEKEKYLKRGPLAVLAVLKNLLKNQTPLLVSYARGQFITKLLAADRDGIVIDYSSNDYDNQLVLEADELYLLAETYGAKVEFALGSPQPGSHQGLPAFFADLPELLWMIQRREFFRVTAPLNPIFYCYVQWPDGTGEGRMRLQDLSLGGLAVLGDSALPEGLKGGEQFRKLRVELGEYGRFEVDAKLINIGKRSVVSTKNETVVTPRLSFRFEKLNTGQERQLQQVIFQLEQLARDKANRFQ
ncbi:flagellar brake protein [Erwinia psidii]|uniref:Flagellar brake protein YcgR n=1 Tax=Erwinia psidii TaxID=69224 RepID=A0A3N6RX43_9GAMM|nr:flagellar brake protein [Erwinia psidii]MCX8955825.1 flagellar brake protein [Erwinia psidii]MCX8961618.1 flagellar brake protein [Erwinia psidii]MCX8965718.1 flagellar brake protein [Erwinia psidii]RQM37658.1 flagellar brake protein [Erwinia psidii]